MDHESWSQTGGSRIGARLEAVYFSLFDQRYSIIRSWDEPALGQESLVVSVYFIPVPGIISLKLSSEVGALNNDSLFLINVPKNRLTFGQLTVSHLLVKVTLGFLLVFRSGIPSADSDGPTQTRFNPKMTQVFKPRSSAL